MAKKLSDVIAAEAFLKFGGRTVKLLWNNRAVANAEQYAEFLHYEHSADELLDLAASGKAHAIACLIYGAMKSANPRLTPYQFNRNFKIDDMAHYIMAFNYGMTKLLPEPEPKDDNDDSSEEPKKKRTRKKRE